MRPIRTVDLTHDQLADALRNAALGDRPIQAAVELLIAHNRSGHWLRRRPFIDHIHTVQDGATLYADVAWHAVAELADRRMGLTDTDSEVGVLRVAASLAAGPLGETLNACDAHNRSLIVDAITHAGGDL